MHGDDMLTQKSYALVSSPSNFQMLYVERPGDVLRERRGGECDVSSLSSYSSSENSADVDDVGERVGDCIISWRKDGSNGAGVEEYPRPEVWYIGCSWNKSACERERGRRFRDTGATASDDAT